MRELSIILDSRDKLGECPRWHAASESLYWLDITARQLHRLMPATGEHTSIALDRFVSAFAFVRGGGFLFAATHDIVRADETGRVLDVLATADMPADGIYNDGAVDAAGRFWVGALNAERRHDNDFYCFADGQLRVADSAIGAGNGIAWDADGRTMYFVDSPRKTIYAYDFDAATGAATNRRAFVTTPKAPGVPDGIATDRDGGVWCAYWDGFRVVRYDAEGRETARVVIPTPRPTACAFGGPDMQTLYITSAADGIAPDQAEFAGHVFAIHTTHVGLVPNEVDI